MDTTARITNSAEELASIIREFQSQSESIRRAEFPDTFAPVSHRFLNEHLGEPHAFAPYFDGIAAVSEALANARRHDEALRIWQTVHGVIARWEFANHAQPGFRPVHMGTPYYFSSGIHFRMGNIEHALMLMHLAVEQDDRNMPGEDTPARRFMALDAANPNQYLRAIVVNLSDFIRARLDWYNTFAEAPFSNSYGALTWDEFRRRFLARGGDLSDIAAFYVLSIARADTLWPNTDAFASSRLAARIYENTLLNLCIVFEELVRHRYRGVHRPGYLPTMKRLVSFLAQQTGLNLTDADLNAVKAARNSDFDAEVNRLLSNRGPEAEMTWRIEEDLLIMYAVRDPVAHQIRPAGISVKRFTSLSDSIMRAIFFVVERLYA